MQNWKVQFLAAAPIFSFRNRVNIQGSTLPLLKHILSDMEVIGYRWHCLISGWCEENDLLPEECLQVFRNESHRMVPSSLELDRNHRDLNPYWLSRKCQSCIWG
ncbi:hypothetical protein AVEN_146766-1 [Araneus ventricosus]|uniref:Uncharacterized protein n=1 Tax=Araneus ventricosus TaxID=182803 RepID=A0A4Y2D7D4_ARAVE|nr:hypothetical protein AVEN_146766-1 [Araneus ventricosus]